MTKKPPEPGSRTDTEVERILRQRAEDLSRPLSVEGRAGETTTVVEFQLAQERFGVEPRYVREVCPLASLTPVPCTPGFVLGIVNLRGEILSVLDLRALFELPQRGLTDLNKILVLEDAAMRFAILADAILGLRTVVIADLYTGLPTLTGVRAQYLKGVTPDRLAVLDGARLLGDRRIVVQEHVAA